MQAINDDDLVLEAVLPVQHRSLRWSPEQYLIWAVFVEGLRAILGKPFRVGSKEDHVTPLLQEEAREWMNSNEIRPFSFLWTCQALGLDPSATRTRIPSLTRLPREVHARESYHHAITSDG